MATGWRSEPSVSSGAVKRRNDGNDDGVYSEEDGTARPDDEDVAVNHAGKVRKREAGLSASLSCASPEESPRPDSHAYHVRLI